MFGVGGFAQVYDRLGPSYRFTRRAVAPTVGKAALWTSDGSTLSWTNEAGSTSTVATSGTLTFDDIGAGTNTNALLIGNGGSLGPTGTGTIDATTLLGNTWAVPEAIGATTPAAANFTTVGTSARITAGVDILLANNVALGGLAAASTGTSYRALSSGYTGNATEGFLGSAFLFSASGDVTADGMFVRSGVATSRMVSASAGLGFFESGRVVSAPADTTVLTAVESRNVITNNGAGGARALTLPTAAAGIDFDFAVTVAQYLRINAAAGDQIQLSGTTSAVAGYIRSNVVGATVRLVAIDATTWMAIAINNTWTVDA